MLLSIPALSAAALGQAPLHDLSGPAGDEVGTALAATGDLDGDGQPDLVVGAPEADGGAPGSGRVHVYSGKTGWIVRTLDGESSGDRFGHSVASLGDLDGDGVDDLVVGAPGYDQFLLGDRGAVYVFSGGTGAQLWKFVGGSGGNRFGSAVAGAGDVDGDGTPDVAFSGPNVTVGGGGSNQGYVAVYSGATFTFLRQWSGTATNEELGHSLAAGSDVTGDGVPDLIAGAPYWDNTLFLIGDAGRVRVLSGAASSTVVTTLSGNTASGRFGASVAFVPDADGDGRDEIAVGEPGFALPVANAGRAMVFAPPSYSTLLTVGSSFADRVGSAVAGVNDVDGDGRGDLIVGATGYDNPPSTDAGVVRVYSVFSQSELGGFAHVGYNSDALMGSAVAAGPDINLDGAPEVLGGAPGDQSGFADGGRIRVVLGNAPAPSNYCTAKVNSQGCTPTISYGGCASVSSGIGLQVVGANVLANAKGVMIWSLTPAGLPFGGGTLCVAPPVKRTPVQSASSNPSYPCTGLFYFLMDQTYLAAHNLVPGTEFYCQYWYRDNGFQPPQNMGLTNGLKAQVFP